MQKVKMQDNTSPHEAIELLAAEFRRQAASHREQAKECRAEAKECDRQAAEIEAVATGEGEWVDVAEYQKVVGPLEHGRIYVVRRVFGKDHMMGSGPQAPAVARWRERGWPEGWDVMAGEIVRAHGDLTIEIWTPNTEPRKS